MVRIDSIKLNSDTATCRFYPENRKEYGELSAEVSTGNLIDVTYPKTGCADMYVAQAKKKLCECVKRENIPQEAYSVWF